MDKFFHALKNCALRFDLLFFILLIVFINFPYLNRAYLPVHDTKCYFELFHFFYSHLFFHNTIAQWMSFESLGVASPLRQLQAFSPFNYLAMLIGWVFRIQDALILYKLSVIFEFFILLFGTYKLSRYIFKRRFTTIFICLALLNIASSWGEQASFNLRVFNMLPLTVYAFILFIDTRKTYYLWLTGFLFCLWIMGSSFYPAAIWVFVLLILGAVLLWRGRRQWTGLSLQPAGLHWLVLSVVLLISYFCLLSSFQKGFDLMSRGQSGTLPIYNFLAYGGISPTLPVLLARFLDPALGEYYLGIMPVFFFMWALFHVRDKKYFSFLLTTLALMALSFQGVLSLVFYLTPGMILYHHLAFLYGTMRIFLLVCAGFGLENFYQSSLPRKVKYTSIIVLAGLFFADATRLSGRLYELAFDDATKNHFFRLWLAETNVLSIVGQIFLFLGLLLALAWISRRHKEIKLLNPIILVVIMVIVCGNAWLVHWSAYKNFPKVEPSQEALLYTVNAHRVEYQPERTMVPQEGRQKDAFLLATRPKSGVNYNSINDFAQFDICQSTFRTEAYPKGFNELRKIRYEVNPDLLFTLGCAAPKIRMVSQAVYFPSGQAAAEAIKTMPALFSSVVLSGGDEAFAKAKLSEHLGPDVIGNISVKSFSDDDLSLDVDIISPTGGWLVYADAYNPGWRATVDGKYVPVYQAYIAFKAIWVDAGQHTVRFFYRNMAALLSSYIVAILGVLGAAAMMIKIFLTIVKQALEKETCLPN